MSFPRRRSMFTVAAVSLALTLVTASPAAAAVTGPTPIVDSPIGYGMVPDGGGFWFSAQLSGSVVLAHYDGASFTYWDEPSAPRNVEVLGVLGDLLLLSAEPDGAPTDPYLWSFDKTTGTFEELGTGAGGPTYPSDFVSIGSVAYFVADTDVLFSYDGVALSEFGAVTDVSDLGVYNGKLYMSADSAGQSVLTVYDPANPGFAQNLDITAPEYFTPVGEDLYFVAYDGGPHLVKYDLSDTAYTEYTGAGAPVEPWSLADIDGTLYFHADIGGDQMRMFTFDGTTFTQVPNSPDYPFYFTKFDDRVFFGFAGGWGTYDPATGAFGESWALDMEGAPLVLGSRLYFTDDETDTLAYFEIAGPALAATGSESAPQLGGIAIGLLALGAIGIGLATRRERAL